MSVYKFHGQWRYFVISEHHGSRWNAGQMQIYCIGGKHWRCALLQDSDPSFCREFVLSSPASQIREARLRQDVLISLLDGSTIHMEGLSQVKMSEMSKLICQIRQQKTPVTSPEPVEIECDGKYLYCDKNMGLTCLEGFHGLCQQGLLCDVTLVAQGEEFHCHRALLAATSTYFHAMLCGNFVERSTDRITLSEITGPTMKLILQYLYTGQVEIDVDTVQNLFNAAHMLQLPHLESACVSYMINNLSDNNCIGVYFFAKNFNKTDLQEAAKERISLKFNKITKAAEFLHLAGEEAADILEMPQVLHTAEEEVYSAALRWLEFDMPARQEHMFSVMKAIRFVNMDECFFRERVKNRGIFKGCRQLQILFEHVIYYLNHPYRWHELDLIMEPRRTKRSTIPRAILYTTADADNNTPGTSGTPLRPGASEGQVQRRTVLELYTAERDSTSYLTEWRNWPTEDLRFPAIATIEAPSQGIYLAGGTRNGKLFIKLDLSHQRQRIGFNHCSWFKLAYMHHSREQFSLVAVERFIYAVGGHHKSNNTDAVEKYILSRNTWVKVASLPCRLRACCAISFRGRLYVFGGDTQLKSKPRKHSLSPNVFCYEPEKDRWSTLCPMKTARALAGCAVYRGKIYVIGGMVTLSAGWLKSYQADNETSEVEVYEPVSDSWSTGPPLPVPLASPGVCKYNGTIYVMGGFHDKAPSRSVFYLHESGDHWVKASTDLYHQVKQTTSVHSVYLPISLCCSTNHGHGSDSDSETTCGTSLEHFDMDSSSHSSDLTGYPNASWDTESSSSGY